MWELDHKESWALKNWCFWTVVLEKTLESPLDYKEIQPVYPKGNRSWILIGRNDAETEVPVLWTVDTKTWLTGKDPDAGKDWRQEEKGMTEDEMVGWHHWLNGHEFEQAPGIGNRQGSWRTAVHGVIKSQTWLSDWTETIVRKDSVGSKAILQGTKIFTILWKSKYHPESWSFLTHGQKSLKVRKLENHL